MNSSKSRARPGSWSGRVAVTCTLAGAERAAAQATPPVSATPPAAAPQAGPPLRTSWTSDRVAVQVGDVVTILIDESTQASADRNETATRKKGRDVGVSLGTGSTRSGASLRTNNDSDARTEGGSTRRGRFVAEMSTRVTEVGAAGLLRIEGTRKVVIDEHEEEVTVRGWVRPQDVRVDHTVDSWRVAEAEILYKSNGSLVKNSGIWSKILDLIVP